MKPSWNQCQIALRTRVLAIMAAVLILLQTLASAQTFTVLHTFHQTDGANPRAALIQDSSGSLCGIALGRNNAHALWNCL